MPLRVKATVCDNRRSAFDVALTLLNPNICAHIVDTHSIELPDYRTFRLSSSLQLDTVVMCVFIDESESTYNKIPRSRTDDAGMTESSPTLSAT